MRASTPACLSCLLFIASSLAAAPATTGPAEALDPALRQNLAWQIALERHCLSPGLIDGRPGAKTALATAEFQRAHALPVTGKLDSATAAALGIADLDVVTTYSVQPADLKTVAPPPRGWVAKSKTRYLGHNNLVEALSERFHCSQTLLVQLNKGKNLPRLQAGDTLRVPAVQAALAPAVHHLEINLAQKAIRGFDASNRLVALFHCSIAKDPARRPAGDARIVGATPNPTYHFDPAMWPEVKNVHQKLLIPPGPKNPVGLCWIALSRRGYGIHGTPNPELIGKTGSHGCFRLPNWDALRLARMVRPGTPVRFIASPTAALAAAE